MKNRTVKLSCRSVWKLFGPDPKGFLAPHNHAPDNAIIADRLIAAGSGHMRRRLGLSEQGGTV